MLGEESYLELENSWCCNSSTIKQFECLFNLGATGRSMSFLSRDLVEANLGRLRHVSHKLLGRTKTDENEYFYQILRINVP